MRKISGRFGAVATATGFMLIMLAAAIAAPAQTFVTAHFFDGTDGYLPQAALVQSTDGNLYGTAEGGGNNNCGSSNGCGTLFSVTPSGTFKTLYSFCSQSGCADGWYPLAGLVQATDGNLYGTTFEGGTGSFCNNDGGGCGTLFKIKPGGTPTTVYNFCSQSNCADGQYPYALIQDTNGNFYGTTYYGGASGACRGGCGTVFKINPSGTLTTLHSFDLTDGFLPFAALVQANDGNLYGTTFQGGTGSFCNNDGFGCGTVFKMTPSGKLTTLYNFCSQGVFCTDGSFPLAGLMQATDENFYGTTSEGGASDACGSNAGGGTVFKVTPDGTLTTLYNFCSQSGGVDGTYPEAALIQDTNGSFYGTTYSGGASDACSSTGPGCGTVFSLSVGLGPFIETEPISGNVGRDVRILGTDLTGATSVMFNGTPAFFKVKSSSEIGAVVPPGATSGPVQVVTPSGTLTSNVNFRAEP